MLNNNKLNQKLSSLDKIFLKNDVVQSDIVNEINILNNPIVKPQNTKKYKEKKFIHWLKQQSNTENQPFKYQRDLRFKWNRPTKFCWKQLKNEHERMFYTVNKYRLHKEDYKFSRGFLLFFLFPLLITSLSLFNTSYVGVFCFSTAISIVLSYICLRIRFQHNQVKKRIITLLAKLNKSKIILPNIISEFKSHKNKSNRNLEDRFLVYSYDILEQWKPCNPNKEVVEKWKNHKDIVSILNKIKSSDMPLFLNDMRNINDLMKKNDKINNRWDNVYSK